MIINLIKVVTRIDTPKWGMTLSFVYVKYQMTFPKFY